MLKVIYEPKTGRPIRDGDLDLECQHIVEICKRADLSNSPFVFVYGTENIFTRIRVAVAEGDIPHDSIECWGYVLLAGIT